MNERADTIAKHLENIQWAVRLVSAIINEISLFHDELDLNLSAIELTEVCDALRKLKSRRAPGVDHIPSESWKSFLKFSFDSRVVGLLLKMLDAK